MEKSIEKASILIEALPYIQSFQNKIVVVKLGGNAMTASGCTEGVLKDIVFMEAVKMKPVLIHGGGQSISQRMKEVEITPRFVEGLRITDEQTIEIVKEVFSEINQQLVDTIDSLGGRAKGLCEDAKIIISACKHLPMLPGPGGEQQPTDIGFVGEINEVQSDDILRITGRDAVPVIAPLGKDEGGQVYNINGDVAAGEIAASLKAEKLVFLTDVEGIMRQPEEEEKPQLFSSLNRKDIETV